MHELFFAWKHISEASRYFFTQVWMLYNQRNNLIRPQSSSFIYRVSIVFIGHRQQVTPKGNNLGVSRSCLASIQKQSQNAHQFATSICPPSPSPGCVCRFASESGGRQGPERSATWTRLMSLSRHTDLCCNTHGRHHKLSHQFSPIGCGMSWLTQFVEKCTCLCLPSL